ncbi:MAG TPA: hypothetical protein VGN68_06460 [Sphingopyxis sp.]|jgi:hypothetical protein|uniref:hypothetical protein n=1 Tax=Sphingopyxis sp. TaxID=1908224 RepID=UPI002E16598C|nr:hypothetical protein [Sphingopyxis sp.]
MSAFEAINVLGGVPANLRAPLIKEFNKIQTNFREHRWEPTELDGGRFAEIVYVIVKGYLDSKFPALISKPDNMLDACKKLEDYDKNKFPRSLRIQVPRLLIALYEIRNQRNIGHIGGDVDPNEMDSSVVVSISKWVFAELVRVFHSLTV